MKTTAIITILVFALGLSTRVPPSGQLIFEGQLVNVYVEKAIYRTEERDNFMLKFSIRNMCDKKVGVDLTDYWKVIYPNQWGIYTKPMREVVDEERMIPDTVFNDTAFVNKFDNKQLTYIYPNETVEFYRDWNGSGETIKLKSKNSFLIITLDGQLLFTDGKFFEHMIVGVDEIKRAIVFEYPLVNKIIPEKALIINKK